MGDTVLDPCSCLTADSKILYMRHLDNRERVQILVITDLRQADALETASKLRGVSKQELLREGIHMITSVPSTMHGRAPSPTSGFSHPNHPLYSEKRKSQKAEETPQAKKEGAKL